RRVGRGIAGHRGGSHGPGLQSRTPRRGGTALSHRAVADQPRRRAAAHEMTRGRTQPAGPRGRPPAGAEGHAWRPARRPGVTVMPHKLLAIVAVLLTGSLPLQAADESQVVEIRAMMSADG